MSVVGRVPLLIAPDHRRVIAGHHRFFGEEAVEPPDGFAAREERKIRNVAIVRIEQLYPLRRDEILETLSVYREGIPVIWVQEEARNMGAWHFMSRNIPPLILSSFRWSGISRPFSASPATGSASRHKLEHLKLVEEALGVSASRSVNP